jgi:hypothetical protein
MSGFTIAEEWIKLTTVKLISASIEAMRIGSDLFTEHPSVRCARDELDSVSMRVANYIRDESQVKHGRITEKK